MKFQSWWWRDLSKVCGEEEGVDWFQEALGWRVGVGDKARFWVNAWADRYNLKIMYPRMYSISLDKGLMAREVGCGKDHNDNGV